MATAHSGRQRSRPRPAPYRVVDRDGAVLGETDDAVAGRALLHRTRDARRLLGPDGAVLSYKPGTYTAPRSPYGNGRGEDWPDGDQRCAATPGLPRTIRT